MVRTIYQQRSRVIDSDRPKFGNRQPPDQAAMPSGHLAVSVRVGTPARHGLPGLTDQESSAPVVRFADALDNRAQALPAHGSEPWRIAVRGLRNNTVWCLMSTPLLGLCARSYGGWVWK